MRFDMGQMGVEEGELTGVKAASLSQIWVRFFLDKNWPIGH